MKKTIVVGAVILAAFFMGCDSNEPIETKAPEPWTQERVEALRMPGVVDAPGKIYRKAYERSMAQIKAENLVERLEALEREIEMERSELP